MQSASRNLNKILEVRLKLRRKHSEMVVERCTLENSELQTAFVAVTCIADLKYYRKTFHEENTAKYRQQKFLVDNDSRNSYNTTDRKTSRISHKNLCWICIVPQESDERPYKSTKEHHHFFTTWYIHHIKIAGHGYMTGNIGENT